MIFEEEGEDEHHNEEHGHFYYPVPVALPFKRAPVGGSSRMNDLVNSVPVSYIRFESPCPSRFHPDMTVGVEVTIVAIPIAHACGQGETGMGVCLNAFTGLILLKWNSSSLM
jgi:hypothetical protein